MKKKGGKKQILSKHKDCFQKLNWNFKKEDENEKKKTASSLDD